MHYTTASEPRPSAHLHRVSVYGVCTSFKEEEKAAGPSLAIASKIALNAGLITARPQTRYIQAHVSRMLIVLLNIVNIKYRL